MKPVTIISLTETGKKLAEKILKVEPTYEHLHRPKPFAQTLQNRFREGHRLILIHASGIALRTLAPVLHDKQTDPAVLLLDENGRYVIPLLSVHEGGANAWGKTLADALQAECIITSTESYLNE